MGALYGSISALLIGLSDIFGRRVAQKTSAVATAALIQLTATVFGLLSVLVVDSTFSWTALGIGAASGLGMGVGLGGYYQSMTLAGATITAPIVATLAAVIPYVFAVAIGADVTVFGIAGALVALAGLLLVTAGGGSFGTRLPAMRRRRKDSPPLVGAVKEPADETALRRGIRWSLVSGSGYGFGLSVVITASDESGSWPTFSQRLAAFALMLAVARRLSIAPMPPAGVRWPAVAGGVLAAGTTVFYLLGLAADPTAAVVTSSMFPAVSVVVGLAVFGDTVRPTQMLGVGVVLAGIVAVALG